MSDEHSEINNKCSEMINRIRETLFRDQLQYLDRLDTEIHSLVDLCDTIIEKVEKHKQIDEYFVNSKKAILEELKKRTN